VNFRIVFSISVENNIGVFMELHWLCGPLLEISSFLQSYFCRSMNTGGLSIF
jgi:hypothetical protein